jgi:hypothetical protein
MPKRWGGKLRDQHFIYLVMLTALMCSAIFSVAEVAVERYANFTNVPLLYALNECYFLAHTVLTFLFTLYILDMTGASKEKNRRFMIIFLFPFFVSELLVLTNPFTKIIFTLDENCSYQRGDFLRVLYAIASFYVILGVTFFFLYKNRLSAMDRTATLILISIAIFGICIQGIWSITVELFFEAICFLGFMLLLEDRTVQLRGGKPAKISRGFVFVISLSFIGVISINISLIYQTGADQTGMIGTIQIEDMKGKL